MSITRFLRLKPGPVADVRAYNSITTPHRWIIVGSRGGIHNRVCEAFTFAQPETEEFERDLQTFKDLCALTTNP